MGAIADGIVAYAKPLLESTDGSLEQMNKALGVAQFCFNAALTPAADRGELIARSQTAFDMDDEEFDEFRKTIILPMIARHEEMFPNMHGRPFPPLSSNSSSNFEQRQSPTPRKKVAFDRYAPCPCNSGKKYKFCCEKTAR